jgi:hypothetical protein
MIRILYLLFGLVLVVSGLRNAQKLVGVVASRGGFTQSVGVIEEVESPPLSSSSSSRYGMWPARKPESAPDH